MKENSGGIGIGIILTIILSVLKFCKIINWSWIWVLCPLWISFIITIIFACIAVAIASKFMK